MYIYIYAYRERDNYVKCRGPSHKCCTSIPRHFSRRRAAVSWASANFSAPGPGPRLWNHQSAWGFGGNCGNGYNEPPYFYGSNGFQWFIQPTKMVNLGMVDPIPLQPIRSLWIVSFLIVLVYCLVLRSKSRKHIWGNFWDDFEDSLIIKSQVVWERLSWNFSNRTWTHQRCWYMARCGSQENKTPQFRHLNMLPDSGCVTLW